MTPDTAPGHGNHPHGGSLLATLALAAAGALWGSGFLFGKIALEQMTVSENVTFRFIFGTAVLTPVLILRAQRFSRRDLLIVLGTTVIGVPIQFLVQFKGLQLTTVSHASLMVGTLPVLLAVCSAIFLGERLSRREWWLLAAASAGAVLIALSSGPAGGPRATITGDVLVVLSMVAAIVMVLSTKTLVHRHDALHLTAVMLIAGTVMLILWSLAVEPVRLHFAARTWFAVAAQGLLATAGAYLLWNWGLARVPASRAGVFLNLEPLLGAVLGVVFLGERLGGLALVGGGMIVASAIYFSTHPHDPSAHQLHAD